MAACLFQWHLNDNDPMPANGEHEFWPILMQRARLNDLGISYNTAKTTDDWGVDNQRTGGKLYNLYEALHSFTGRTTSGQYTTQVRPERLRDSLADGDIVVAGTSLGDNGKDKGKGVTSGIIGGHAYAIVDVFNQAGTWKVKMYNPYGRDIDKQADGRTLDGNGLARDDGFITLDWAQFVKGLRVVVTAKRPVR